MKRGNCWIYALARWVKNPRGTYIVIRLSRRSIWPHLFFAESIDGLEVSEFVPDSPRRGVLGFFHALWYRGRIRFGAGENEN